MNRKFKAKHLLVLVMIFLGAFAYYRTFCEKPYSTDFITKGKVLSITLANNGGNILYRMEIEYNDSRGKRTEEIYEVKSEMEEYIKVKSSKIEKNDEINIITEEGFTEGFLGKRFLYSIITNIHP
ncbi:MAG: hypothetical protein ACRC92_10605 [Peptostreptococcaceae bacterium]